MSTIILGIEVTVLFCVVAISIIWTILQERFHNLCLHLLHLVMLGIIVLIAYIGGYDTWYQVSIYAILVQCLNTCIYMFL